MTGLIVIMAFASALLLCYQIAKVLLVRSNYILRIKKYINNNELKDERRKNSKTDTKETLNLITKGVGNIRFLSGYKRRVQTKLTRAHLLLKAEEFITLCIISSLTLGVVFLMLKGIENWLIALLAAAGAWFLPPAFLNAKVKKRIKALNEQLEDAIVLISNSLKAGYSFFQAVDTVAGEMSGPISEEFSVLQKEINLGLSTERALENLSSRVSSDALELIVTAVLIQRQVGGNLAEVLDNISTTIRDRIRIKAEIKTVTAQGRMSGWIISLLPAGIGMLIYLINPQYMSVLFTRSLGLMILVVSIMMELMGIFFISRIVKIEI